MFAPIILPLVVLALTAPALGARIGDMWGTNIHWTTAGPGEAAMLASAYKVARMDFTWQSIESVCGKYDFSGTFQYTVTIDCRELEASTQSASANTDCAAEIYVSLDPARQRLARLTVFLL